MTLFSKPSRARAFVTALLMLVGTVCTDRTAPSPLSPDDDPNRALAGLTVSPANDTALIGQTIPLAVSGVTGNKAATWTSSDPSIATVVSTGSATALVTGRATGLVTITASTSGKSGTASVRVLPVPVRSVTVAPDTSRVQPGDSTRFTATPRDSAGNALTGRSITWSSADTNIATVSTTGMARARARGTVRIRATADGVTGESVFIVVVPELSVPTMSVQDSVNVGDTLRVWYSVQNLGDTPFADSVIVRVGLRSVATGAVARAVRRAVPRVASLATGADSVRFIVPSASPGAYVAIVFVDCRDVAGTSDESRLADCLATPASAGAINESNETNNPRSAPVGLRGPELTASALTAPDTGLTRTNLTASLTITNSGSATPAGFEAMAGLYDVTTSTVVVAAATPTAMLASRQTRVVNMTFAIPATIDLSHQYQVRAYADCANGAATLAERLRMCITTPATVGAVAESNENDNGASRAAIVLSNVARVAATPDTIRFATLGDSVIATAVAFDRVNAPVSGVIPSWVSLDPAASVSPAGVVRSLVNGSARIVANVDGKADTIIVIVSQQVTSVVVTPDSALVPMGGTTTLTAVLRDGAGNVITTMRPSWTTLDPTIAAVDTLGRVTGIATGVARVIAARDGRADTTVAYVIPAGFTHRWLGVSPLGWNEPSNWFPHTAPTRNVDSPFIPSGVSQRPFLTNDVTIGSIRVAAGTSLDLRGRALNVHGNVDASGPIDTGSVVMRVGGSLAGTLPSVTIQAPSQLAARTSAQSVTVQDSSGRLTINGQTLIASFVGVTNGGRIIEANANDTIWVTSNAVFNGPGSAALSAGVLRLDGALSQFGPAGSFVASGTHTTIFRGTQQQIVSFADTTSGFQNVNIVNSAGAVQLQNTLTVRGLLRLVSGGRVSMSQGSLRVSSRLPDIAQGTYDVQTTVVSGVTSMQQNHVFANTIFVDNGGALTLNGHTLDARMLNTYDGAVLMTSPADTLIIRENAMFYGHEYFAAGTLIVYGGLSIGYAPSVQTSAFQASGTHTTIFNGAYQSWMIDQPTRHFFANVRVRAAANVQLNNDAHVYGRLTMDVGSALTQNQSNYIHYYGPLPDATRGSYQVYNTKIARDLTLAEDVVLPSTTNLWMGETVTFNLNGHKLDVNAFWTGGPGSRFIMPGAAPAESLLVRERVYLGGSLDLYGGVIANYGDLTQLSVPRSWGAPVPMRTKYTFLGTRPHQVMTNGADSIVFADLEIRDGGTVTGNQHVILGGLLTLGPGSTLNLGQYEVRVDRSLPAVDQGTLNASGIVVRGHVSMDASRRYTGSSLMLRVAPNAHLDLNGHTLDVAATFAIEGASPNPGVLVMDKSLDSLVARGQLYLFGSAQLSAGTLVLKGDVYQGAGSGVFAGGGTHTTVFDGAFVQRAHMLAAPATSFGNVQIDNAAGVEIDEDMDIRGQLRGSGGGVIRSTVGKVLNVTGGLDAAGLVLDGTPLNVAGGTLTRFDNVTFRNFPMFYPAQLRIRHPGTGATFTMNNIAFLTDVGPGAYWIDADDTDAGTGVLRIDLTSPQSVLGPAKTSSGSALVSWRAP